MLAAVSLGGVATVDGERDADDEAGARAAQPENGGGDFVCLTKASDGLVCKGLRFVQLSARDHCGDHRGLEGAGADRVDPDSAGCEQVRHARDQVAVDAALQRVEAEAGDPEINLMPALIDAVKVYASLGEVMASLGTVFGRHVEVPTI